MADKLQVNNRIIDLIFDLSRLVRVGMSFDWGSKHLTLHQLQTMFYIAKQRQVRMADVAQNFNVTKPTATVLIDNLVQNGYLKRTVGKTDKREVKISLAKKGQRILDQAKKIRSAKINHILSFVSDSEKRQLKKILQVVVEKLKENEN